MKNVICSKALWRGLLLFLVLTSSVGLAEKVNVNLKQMKNEQLIKLLASPKHKDGIKAYLDNKESYGRLYCYFVGPLAVKKLLVNSEDYEKASLLMKEYS